MPTYSYSCAKCGDFSLWQSMKDEPINTHTCGGKAVRTYEVLRTNGIGVRGAHYATTEATEKQWHKDMSAYKRLVKDGTQPQRIDGCDYLESNAVSKWHIETGQPHPDHKVWEGIETAKSIMRDSPLDSVTSLRE